MNTREITLDKQSLEFLLRNKLEHYENSKDKEIRELLKQARRKLPKENFLRYAHLYKQNRENYKNREPLRKYLESNGIK